ncbi:unnamed protein product [Pleuronectes platessa]|uniref:Uncharacterized protein n=1 Tax=Pleuronectes platessa TaxID=8262 RepID=A0A9N7TT54_PLEPL|nr:unnamed protein product [Pleuronectes platessa]
MLLQQRLMLPSVGLHAARDPDQQAEMALVPLAEEFVAASWEQAVESRRWLEALRRQVGRETVLMGHLLARSGPPPACCTDNRFGLFPSLTLDASVSYSRHTSSLQ